MNVYLTGLRRSGKDTAARAISLAYGLRVVALTEPLYAIAREYFGMAEKDRETLQKVGDAFRAVDEMWLINHVVEQGDGLVCADIRLPIEARALRNGGWIGLRVERPEEDRLDAVRAAGEYVTGEQARHHTETMVAQVPVDGWINNNGTPEELGEKAVAMVKAILRAREDHAWLHMRPVGREILPPYEIDEP